MAPARRVALVVLLSFLSASVNASAADQGVRPGARVRLFHRGRHWARNVIIATGVGLGTGLVLGKAEDRKCRGCDDPGLYSFFYGAIGTGAGLVGGVLFSAGTDPWKEVPPSRWRVELAPTPGGVQGRVSVRF